MISIRSTSHDPRKCRDALARSSAAIIDLETTGISRHDRIVAAGVLIGRDAFIMVTEEHHDLSSVGTRISSAELREALSPLRLRQDLVVVFHNAAFDLAMLERHGMPVGCIVHDTMKLLKLIDSDRGREQDDGFGTGTHTARFERRYGECLNYKLKDVARHLLNTDPQDFPGNADRLRLDTLVAYLKSDLITTSQLYDRVSQMLDVTDRLYNDMLIAPITPLLVRMTTSGVEADPDFIDEESDRLEQLMQSISEKHRHRFGIGLDVGDFALRGWIYFKRDGLRCEIIPTGKKRLPSLRTPDLKTLHDQIIVQSRVKESLGLIHDYQLIRSRMIRLRSLAKHVDRTSRRIHSNFNDFQSSGRVSSTNPNLQQIAKTIGEGKGKRLLSDGFEDVVVKSRNAILASPGFELVRFDISQADIRVLAHTVESFRHHAEPYLDHLQESRVRRLPGIAPYRSRMWQYFQPENKKQAKCPHCWNTLDHAPSHSGGPVLCPKCGGTFDVAAGIPPFDPSNLCILAEDFRLTKGDFYITAAKRMLKSTPEAGQRESLKRTILGIVNGMSAGGLAKQLDGDKSVAVENLEIFTRTYPQVATFSELTKHIFAITGESFTFGGRRRRVTPHWWMVNSEVVDLFVSYKDADKLWLRVVPLQPNRFTLTCWVLRAIDARYGSPNEGQEIYEHQVGRISKAPYRFFEDEHLVFRLPVRNIPWRLIRRVRTRTEEAKYEGFDRTWRQLFNHVAQGGTADIAKTMMLRSMPVCSQFDARLILQIHDELVFEAPKRRADEFTRAMNTVLLQPPTADFKVPMALEAMRGIRFGDLRVLHPAELSRFWIVRTGFKIWSSLKTLLGKLTRRG